MKPVPLETHERIVAAMEQHHRVDLSKLEMQLVLYRRALTEAGVRPPDTSGAELLKLVEDSKTVISTASRFAVELGSAKELLASW